jgi:hypothetical protein
MFRVVSVLGFAFLTVAAVALAKNSPRNSKQPSEEPIPDKSQTDRLAAMPRLHTPVYYVQFSLN